MTELAVEFAGWLGAGALLDAFSSPPGVCPRAAMARLLRRPAFADP